MLRVAQKDREFIMEEAKKVYPHRKFAFYRWILNIIQAGKENNW